MPVLRLPAAALLLTIAAASSSANAQTVPLHLEWESPTGTKTCVFTTDGVSMVGGGPTLKAKGTFTTDCPTGTTTPPAAPQIVDGIDLAEIPTSTTAGAVHNITWSASNAESCDYAESSFQAAVSGWPTSGSACTSTTDCANPRTVPVTMPSTPGSYTFALTCKKTGFTAVRSTRTTTIPGTPPPGCIAPSGLTRLLSGRVSYNDGNDRNNIDLTRFENVFGHDNQGGSNRAWPGTQNINQRISIPRNNYVSLQFTVPSNFHVDTRGQYRLEETAPTASYMSITISKTCGDFSATPTAPLTDRCILDAGKAGVGLNSALTWGKSPLTSRCVLEPGQTYFLNIVHAKLATPTTSGCANGSCANTIQNQNMNPSSNPTIGWP